MSKSKIRKKQDATAMLVGILVVLFTFVVIALLILAVVGEMKKPERTPTIASQATTAVIHQPTGTTTKREESAQTPVQTTTAIPKPVTTPTVTMPQATTAPKPPETMPAPGYVYHIDMDKYEEYIDPTGDRWHDDYLLLVNADRPISNGFENNSVVLSRRDKMTNATDYSYGEANYLNVTALKALTAMFLEARAQGIKDLDSTSSYRDYAYQKMLFDRNCSKTYHWVCADDNCNVDWISKYSGQSGGAYYSKCPICALKTTKTIPITREEQEASVSTYSCAPGTSDHQTGLAVDIIQTSLPSRFDSLIQEFGETDAGKWLAANAHHFGFVLRFPEDKEAITGIIYEPWHFRYVGRTHATAMYENGMCLEEYVAHLSSIGYFN